MDYYEELGLDRTATEEDIKRAHRRLAKLLHPDQQTDEAVKQVAEAQMRRLNGIVDVLSKPELRREYDEQLIASIPGFSWLKLRRRAFHSWPWWVGSTVGAILLTVGAVWLFANRWGSSFGRHTPTYISSGAEATSESEPDQPVSSPAPTPVVASVVADPRERDKPSIVQTSEQTAQLPQPHKATVVIADVARRKTLHLPSAGTVKAVVTGVKPPVVSPSSAVGVVTASLPADALPSEPKLPATGATAAKPRDALEGEWVYAPTQPEPRTAGFYLPEFIDLKIWNESGLRGEYHARYHVVDKPIPPEVTFALVPDGAPRRFTWISSNGSKGTLQVSAIEPRSIRIEWRTTVFSRGPALTAGTATLVRRAPQTN
jgi:curved DNA-binding protein CbpA